MKDEGGDERQRQRERRAARGDDVAEEAADAIDLR